MSNVPPDDRPPGGGWGPPPGGQPPGPQPPPAPPGGWQQQPPPPPGGYPQGYGYQQPRGQETTTPWGQPLAEWWKRLVAIIVDFFILWIPLQVLSAIAGVSFNASVRFDPVENEFERSGGLFDGAGLPVMALSIVAPILYYGLLNGSPKGQTVGKMLLKIQVRDANSGGPIGPGRGLIRAVVYQVLFLACVIPGIVNGLSPLWDRRRQAWHDKAANSLVVDAP